jgi:hypothetical protein
LFVDSLKLRENRKIHSISPCRHQKRLQKDIKANSDVKNAARDLVVDHQFVLNNSKSSKIETEVASTAIKSAETLGRFESSHLTIASKTKGAQNKNSGA